MKRHWLRYGEAAAGLLLVGSLLVWLGLVLLLATSALIGLSMFLLLARSLRQRAKGEGFDLGYAKGVAAGRRLAENEHGWHPAVSDGWNLPEVPRPRDGRSPDFKLVTRPVPSGQPARPNFHR